MTALTLPKLAGSRQLVVTLLDEIPSDLEFKEVVINAEELVSAAPSFVDELCKQLLVTRNASRLTVNEASERFLFYLQRSAVARGVADRLVIVRVDEACSAPADQSTR